MSIEDNYFNINPENKLNLPEGTPVYITSTNQIAFYERPARSEGASKIKNVGVVSNEELRKPIAEDFDVWEKEGRCTKEEVEKFLKLADNWDIKILFN
jgi:hypothetical protein